MGLKDYPFTIVLTIIGIFIGLSMPGVLKDYSNNGLLGGNDRPAGITAAAIQIPGGIMLSSMGGIVGGIILGLPSLIIESINNLSKRRYREVENSEDFD